MDLGDDPIQTPLQKAGGAATRSRLADAWRGTAVRRLFGTVMVYGTIAGALIGYFAGLLFLLRAVPLVPAAIGGFVSATVIGVIAWYLVRKRERHLVAAQYASQHEKRAEDAKRIAEARASGAFDQWEERP